MPPETSAGRLLDVFDVVAAIDTPAPFRTIWSQALGHQPDSFEEAQNMTEMARLLSEVQRTATLIARGSDGFDLQPVHYSFPKWSKVVFGWGYKLTGDQEIRGRNLVTDEVRSSLSMTHNMFHAARREPVFGSDREKLLNEALQALDSVLKDLNSSGLPYALTFKIANSIVAAEEAIRMIRFRGDEAIGFAIVNVSSVMSETLHLVESSSAMPNNDLHDRIASWAATLAVVSDRVSGALWSMGATPFYLATGDPGGAALILGLQPSLAPQLVQSWLLGPRALPTTSSDGSDSGESI